MKLAAVVPVYNENPEKLATVLANLKNYVEDIVVVDDGSAFNYALHIPHYTLLKHEINRGQGAALQTGTDYAVQNGADIIVHFDADGQHQAADIPNLIRPLKEGKVDIVFGSRFLGKKNNLPWSKKFIILPIGRVINFLFSGLLLSDAHNGLRAFRADVSDKLYLSQDRMAHATEYLQLVKKNRLRYAEVGVNVNYHCYGQNIDGGIKIVKELLTEKIFK